MLRAPQYACGSKFLSTRFWRSLSCPFAAGALVVVGLYIIGFVLLGHFFYLLRHPNESEKRVSSWSGWSGVKYLFTFGDSYTTTSFDVRGVQPNSADPLGNSNGFYPWGTQVGSANYVEYLTTKYNRSLILTYNFGWAGATTDNRIDESPYGSLSFREQVERQFLPNFGKKQPYQSWEAENSLFTVFFGINDIAIFNYKPNASDYITAVLSSYGNATEQLYGAGARNLLFVNVPAVDRSPEADPNTPGGQRKTMCIQQFNVALHQFAKSFIAKHLDTSVFFLDANFLTNKVLDNPKSYAISSVIRNTTDFCEPYKQSPDPNLFDPACGIPRNEYFWADQMHPTSTVHDLIADQIVVVALREEL